MKGDDVHVWSDNVAVAIEVRDGPFYADALLTPDQVRSLVATLEDAIRKIEGYTSLVDASGGVWLYVPLRGQWLCSTTSDTDDHPIWTWPHSMAGLRGLDEGADAIIADFGIRS